MRHRKPHPDEWPPVEYHLPVTPEEIERGRPEPPTIDAAWKQEKRLLELLTF